MDALLMTVHADAAARPAGPVLIVGDFNGALSSFNAFAYVLDAPDSEYVDIGGDRAPAWGAAAHTPTCRSKPGATPTRRDYIIAGAAVLAGISCQSHSGALSSARPSDSTDLAT